MRVTITRKVDENSFSSTYEIASTDKTLLEILKEIKSTQDSTLSFRHQCGSGICGSCSMNVNGVAVRACTYKPSSDTLQIDALNGFPIVRDLIIDDTLLISQQQKTKAFLHQNDSSAKTTETELKKYALQSECIKCNACYSACPVFQTNPDFIGPLLLTKSWRYFSDVREGDYKSHIENIQPSVWDCILCGDCIPVCPVGISPKMDITFLQTKSSANGYSNPNAMSFGGGFGDPYSGFGSPFN
jgi:succinate dehydrogenase / fumarate reductase, iron-sulfur subunit